MTTLLLVSSFASAQDGDSLSDSLSVKRETPRAIQLGVRPTRDEWFSQDKFLHFAAGAAIPGLTYHLYVCRLKRDETWGKIYSVSLTALIALGKEIYDKKKKGHFSWKDLCWGGLGLTAGYFVFIH